jgi:exonuclease III
VKIISWNIAHSHDPWRYLLESDADIALLQEASKPPPEFSQHIEVDNSPWVTIDGGSQNKWRTAVVNLSKNFSVDWIEAKSLSEARVGEFGVSQPGSLAAAYVTPVSGESLVVVSMYALWEGPMASIKSRWSFADGSAHRIVSDLSAFIGRQRGHRIIAAGDLNILNGYGEYGSRYWKRRYQTVFDRLDAIGLPFAGPQARNGQQACPWPDELPQESKNVPTYRTNRKDPKTAGRQLDFVFASLGLFESVSVRAINEPDQWGPSDHCRVEIEVSSD